MVERKRVRKSRWGVNYIAIQIVAGSHVGAVVNRVRES